MGSLLLSVNPVSLIVALIILAWEVKVGDGMHTGFCFRFPKGSFPDASYNITGRTDVNSPGIEKFPQHFWSKYKFSTERWLNGNPDDGFPDNPNRHNHIWFEHDNTRLRIKIHPIKGRTQGSDALSGWYRIELNMALLNPWTSFVKSFILFATDEQGNFMGTWERNPFTQDSQDCPQSSESKYMIIPCGGVSKYEPHVSNVILYARNNSKDGNIWPTEFENLWPIVPDYTGQNSIDFYWKFSMQDSNRNKVQQIQFRVIADPDHTYDEPEEFSPNFRLKDLEKALIASHAVIKFFPEAVPGAADALPTKRTSLACTQTAVVLVLASATISGRPNYESNHWHWYWDFFLGDLEWDILNHNTANLITATVSIHAFQIDTRTGCTSNFYEGRCGETRCSISRQGLGIFYRNYVNKSLIPQVHSTATANCKGCTDWWDHLICEVDLHDTPKWFNNKQIAFNDWWYEYKESVIGQRCAKTEGEVSNSSQVTVIRRNNRNNTIYHWGNQTYYVGKRPKTFPIQDLYRRGVRQYGFGTVLYGIRKGHGIVMLLLTLFFTPVSIFVSRYYKETFMSTRILYAKVWFQIHLQLIFWSCALFVTGLLLTIISRGFLGVSLVPFAVAHRVIGWISFVVFIILLLTGGIRAMNDPWRAVTIFTHFLLGYIFYLLNAVAVITSLYIPGSPSANHDESSEASDDGGKADKLTFVLVGWVIFELVVHISMTFLIYSYDRWMQVERPRKFIPPIIGVPIPVLKENSDSDASGAGIRLVAFCAYIGFATLVSFVGSLQFLSRRATKELGFGPMSCTHVYDPSLTSPNGDGDYGIYQFRMLDQFDESCKWEY